MEEDCVVSQYLYAIYDKPGHVYAPFMSNRLHYHHKLVARFTHPETVTNL
jgi:hypothetical protein